MDFDGFLVDLLWLFYGFGGIVMGSEAHGRCGLSSVI